MLALADRAVSQYGSANNHADQYFPQTGGLARIVFALMAIFS